MKSHLDKLEIWSGFNLTLKSIVTLGEDLRVNNVIIWKYSALSSRVELVDLLVHELEEK